MLEEYNLVEDSFMTEDDEDRLRVAQAGNGDDGNNVNASSFAKATDVATSSI
jgi:hypothetical protein